jgi:hypothetical protein
MLHSHFIRLFVLLCCTGQYDIAGLFGAIPEDIDVNLLGGTPPAEYNKRLQVGSFTTGLVAGSLRHAIHAEDLAT